MAKTKTTSKAVKKALVASAAPDKVANTGWSDNNVACIDTWLALSETLLHQLDGDFYQSENVSMDELDYWVDEAAARKASAGPLVDMMIKLFTNVWGATYEKGYNYASAFGAMLTIIIDGSKTVSQLASVVDELFHFHGEVVK
jgi:hypothetical protein